MAHRDCWTVDGMDGRGWGLGNGLPMVIRVSSGGIFKIKTASSDNSGGRVVELLCVEP